MKKKNQRNTLPLFSFIVAFGKRGYWRELHVNGTRSHSLHVYFRSAEPLRGKRVTKIPGVFHTNPIRIVSLVSFSRNPLS